MDDRRQHLGIARVREIEGQLVLVFPRPVMVLLNRIEYSVLA